VRSPAALRDGRRRALLRCSEALRPWTVATKRP